jgi:hypothetical protein
VGDLQQISERWVSPVYLRLLHGNFRHLLLAEELSDKRSQEILTFRRCVAEVTPEIVTILLRQPEWRARLVGGWYAGLRGWRQFRDELGTLLVESRLCFAGQGYCAALACCADAASAEYLRRYLEVWLPQTDRDYDQHWALPALAWIDRRLGTQHAADYLAPGGLWDQWAAASGHEGPAFYLDAQRTFDLTLAAFRAG